MSGDGSVLEDEKIRTVPNGIKEVEDPETYQDFFTTLGKSVFLTAHNVD